MVSRRSLLLAAMLISCLAACSSVVSTPIGKILNNPREYEAKTLSISGEVTEVFSILVVKYFILKDSSGSIAVVTDRVLPKVGQKISVKGTLEEAFSLGDQQLIVLIESPRETR